MNYRKNKLELAARITLGLIFSVFGLNGFFQFLPQPELSQPAGAFIGALAATGYMLPLIKATEVVAGILLLTGRAVPFALTLLAPVVVNIVAYHLFLEPRTLAIPLVTLGLGLYLAWSQRSAYAPLFRAGAKPELAPLQKSGGHAATAA
jgi:uncharacterized membrane protein YphA (DoxX/SURF4 family)